MANYPTAPGLLNENSWFQQNQPIWQGLLGMSQALAQAGAPSPYPVNFGSAIAQGAGAFQQGIQQAQDRQDQMEDREFKRQQYAAEAQRLKNWNALFGGSTQTPTAPQLPGAPNSQTASGAPMLPSSNNDIFAGVPQDILALASMSDPDTGLKMIADWRAGQGDAPKTVGGMQWNPNAIDPQTGGKGAFVPITGYTEQASKIAAAGRAPQQPQQPSPFGSWYAAFKAENQRAPNAKEIARWNNENSGGSVTPAQEANNAEIDAARSYVEQSGLSREEILRRTQSADNLGLENPEYDPYLANAVKLGFQRKIGDDPQFSTFQQRYRGGSTATPTTTPPPAGTGTNAPGGTLDLPRTSSGEVDSSRLKVNNTYSAPNEDGSIGKWRWTGTDFIEAQ